MTPISLEEWRILRSRYSQRANEEQHKRFDLGMGTLPPNVAVNDLILRDLIARVDALEKNGKK